jgi:hypothetical protein
MNVMPPVHAVQANLAAVRVLPTRSAAVRSYAESHLLEALAGRLATVALSGFIFFGSSVLVSDKVGGAWVICWRVCCQNGSRWHSVDSSSLAVVCRSVTR